MDRRPRARSLALVSALAFALVSTGCAAPPPSNPQASVSPVAVTSPTQPVALARVPTTPIAAAGDVLVPLVPVVRFWSTARSISRATLATALAGTGPAPRPVYVTAEDLASLSAFLGVTPGANVAILTASQIRERVATTPGTIGLLRPDEVTLRVRALAVDGVQLFGTSRIHALGAWPLLVPEPAGTRPSAFDPASTWTLVAGGDVNLERSVYRRAVLDGKGPDYPWNGGLAHVTSRYCCGWPGLLIMRAATIDGTRPAARRMLVAADLAVANLEGPAPDDFTWHPDGLTFSMDPSLLVGLDRAGFDVVSLANNHIRNAGGSGVMDTIRHLDELGIGHAGAGADLARARRPAWRTIAGVRVAILGFNGVGTAANAKGTRAGAAPLDTRIMTADIRAARIAGADVVVVMPHWGVEYTDGTTARQRTQAQAAIDAGADLVLGNHSHWAGPVALRSGRLVAWSMGDLLFDLNHDERTQEAMLVEVTFAGRRAVQVNLVPTVVVDRSQLNLLAPAGGGSRLLRQIAAASTGFGAP